MYYLGTLVNSHSFFIIHLPITNYISPSQEIISFFLFKLLYFPCFVFLPSLSQTFLYKYIF